MLSPPTSEPEALAPALQDLIERTRDGVVVVDRVGRIEFANDRAAELAEGQPTDLVGTPFQRFFPPEIREAAMRCFASQAFGEEIVEVVPLQTPTGSTREIELRVRRIEQGRALAVLRDVGELDRHQGALRVVSETLSKASGEDFFDQLVLSLVDALPIDFAFVGELIEPDRERVRLHAFAGGDGPVAAPMYDLAGTPCRVAIRQRRSVFTSKTPEEYPDDAMLADLGVQTYYAIPLLGPGQEPLGILGTLNRTSTSYDEISASILDLVASRAASEIQSRRTDEARGRAERLIKGLVRAGSRLIWSVDPEGKGILDAADTWQEATGIELEGEPEKSWLEAVVAEERGRVGDEWEAAFSEQRDLTLDYPVETPDGIRHLHVRGIAIHAEDGAFEGFIGTMDDVTELHRAQEDLRRRNDVLRMIRVVPEATHNGAGFLESVQVALGELCRSTPFELGRLRMQGSPQGPFEYTGLHCGEACADGTSGRYGTVRSPLDDDDELADRIESASAPVWLQGVCFEDGDEPQGGPDAPDMRVNSGVGGGRAGKAPAERRWSGLCTALFVPVRYDDDLVAILELLAPDEIEEDRAWMEAASQMGIQLGRSFERDHHRRQAREAERKAQESQRLEAIGRLAGGIAHDFNNLLMVILGEVDLALKDADVSPTVQPALEEIRASGRRAAALTSQLLAFSRREIERAERVELGGLLREAERMLNRVLGEDVILDTSGLPPVDDEIFVEISPGLIEQVVLNLVVNAREAMPDGGTIQLGLGTRAVDPDTATALVNAEEGSYAVVSVHDTGVGIPDEIRESLFEPFFTTKENGSGFGLSTSYGIVSSAGGFIEIESEEGAGSEFRVHLPLVEPPASSPGADADALFEAQGKAERILVVEDDDAVRSIAVRILSLAGYDVSAAKSLQEAKELLDRSPQPPDVLLTDCVLERDTGREVDAMVRERHPDIGTVFMSGYTDDVLLRQGLYEAGGEFLPKPFSPEALVDAIERVHDRGRTASPPTEHE